MKIIDADKFLTDIQNICCDVCDTDERCPAYSEFGHSFEQIRRVVEKQKTILAEPVVHAKWIKKTRNGGYWFCCAKCKEVVPKDRYGHDHFSRRCPNCGAYMTIESEGTDDQT